MSARTRFHGSHPDPEGPPLRSPSAPLSRLPERAATGMRARWTVTAGDEVVQVEADEVEISTSGVLSFFRVASRMEMERTLLIAFAGHSWQRCERDVTDATRHATGFE